jgi:hypothetical protein
MSHRETFTMPIRVVIADLETLPADCPIFDIITIEKECYSCSLTILSNVGGSQSSKEFPDIVNHLAHRFQKIDRLAIVA